MRAGTFDSLVADWFAQRFGNPTEPQSAGWREIAAGRDVLISAPTGSGKTLAAFLIAIDGLVRESRANSLPDQTQVLYISPLKALSNDVHKNLETPLAEIAALAREHEIPLTPIRSAVRTGDTPISERQKMSRHAPHILVTTPESLFILLTAEKSRRALQHVQTVIVDEIHAVADDKRGAHLALTLARLDALVRGAGNGRSPQRIGLSATVRPIEEVARYLSPNAAIVDIGHRREMDLAVEVPNDELGAVATSEMWDEIYDRIARHIQQERTTIVFVNTRRLSERVARALGDRLGSEAVLPHHGSLSRALRLDAEARLKAGALKAVVATASLELGIDIGTVDLAIQIGSPRSIAVALQRFGRSGHWLGAKPRGLLFPTTRDELIETAALVYAIRQGDLERIEIPENSLDILAQQIVAETAAQDWDERDLYRLIQTAYPFRNLDPAAYGSVVSMLSDGITTTRGRSGAHLHRDQVNHRLRGRRGARLAAITSGGAIPDTSLYTVIAEPEGKAVGTLDEDFTIESTTGDVFLLGTHSWRIRHVGQGTVRVEDAQGAQPSIPFWLGEAPGRSAELSAAVSTVREYISNAGSTTFLTTQCGLDEAGAIQATAYVRAGVASLGALPSTTTVVAERFFDESGGMQLILHAPFGSRINRAWGLALRKRFCRTFNFELQAAATDNGIVISLSEQHAFPLEAVFEFLHPETLEDVLSQALLAAPMFNARWRWNATRALAILRFRGGSKVPAPLIRMRSEDLLASVFPDQVACAENLTGPPRIPDHPLVRETIANCLHEAMDLDGLMRLLQGFDDGTIKTIAIDNPAPSLFSHEILNANPFAFLDDAPLEERRARAVQIRSTTRTDVGAAGVLDPAAIDQITAEVWPDPRDADELHDALLTLISAPATQDWQPWFEELTATGRAFKVCRRDIAFWVAAERRDITGDVLATVRGWMDCLGPITAAGLAARLALPLTDVRIALATLEAEGQVFQGRYRPGVANLDEPEWCNRRILARIHRATLGRLRREIEPVTAAQFHEFLWRWQHTTPATQLHGADGTLQVVRQLQGFEIPASSWEPQILAKRIAQYSPEFLDELCLSGEVAWARLSPHPAIVDGDRRIRPTRIAPVTFFLREDAGWLTTPQPVQSELTNLSHPARGVLNVLTDRGASFFGDLVRIAHHLPSEVEDALWELTAAGLVTADGFENLRALIDPKRRRGEGSGRQSRPRHAAGRWALVDRTPQSALSNDERTRKFAELLLRRWGVLFRDLLTRETLSPPWRELLPILRRMEAQGEIRGGRFVAGFTGEQYARPEAIDLLRAVRRAETPTHPSPDLSPSDPLALAGIILPGPRVSPIALALPAPA